MKLAKSEPTQRPNFATNKMVDPDAESALGEDDWITAGITHHVTINGEDAWPKVEIGTKVRHDETADEAFERASMFVNNKVIALAEAAAQTVEESGR